MCSSEQSVARFSDFRVKGKRAGPQENGLTEKAMLDA
jgi:hypothetical protein